MILKNWKTTLTGLGFGVALLTWQGITSGIKPKDALIAAALAAIGTLAKDHNVTGN